jgi:hypothetical protein
MKKVIQEWKRDPTKSAYERSLATEREKNELQKIKNGIIGKIEEGLANCHIIHRGQARAIVSQDSKASAKIREEIAKYFPSLYSKFEKVPVTLKNERQDILDVLEGKTRLSNEVERLKIFDKNNKIIENAPLIDEIRILLNQREAVQLRTTGKDLLDRYTNPPYGWDPGVVRVGIAAMLKEGKIRVLINKKPYENPGYTQLQNSLRNLREFVKIEVELEELILEYDKIEDTRKALIRITGDKKIEETISGIAEAFATHAAEMIDKIGTIQIWVRPADFPLPQDFIDAKEKISEITKLPNNARIVDEIYNNISLIEDGSKKIKEIHEFQEKWGQTYLEMKNHFSTVQMIEYKLETNSPCKQFIDDFNSAKSQKNISDPQIWKALQHSKENSSLEIRHLQKEWKEVAGNIIDDTLRKLPTLLDENGIDQSRKKSLEEPLIQFQKEIQDENNISRIANLPQRANVIVEQLREKIRNLIVITPPPSPTKDVENVYVANIFFERRISKIQEWQKLVEKLDRKVTEILQSGKDVKII